LRLWRSALISSEGLSSLGLPTSSLTRRFVGSFRSRGSVTMLARTLPEESSPSLASGLWDSF